ncbi:MAG: NAD-dependent epimerase/dehydratase family protein [Bacteroidales bacterium]|jgi:nucleoside-diphosphate-sugar epimerase|nr:NAD-dependent epimerase/dehydratase family protein [Bacteroidales bacterium]
MESVNIKGTSIFVTGGAGFVGCNLVKKVLDLGVSRVLVIDNLISSERENLPCDDRITFIQGSVTERAVLDKLNDDYEYGFHLTTFHGNQNSIYDPIQDHHNNTLPTLMLCERIRDFKRLKKVVYSSAGCTVAKKTYEIAEATTEESPISMYLDSPYQMSKIFGEFYFNYYFCRYGLPIVKARFQNIYGPGEVLGAGEWRGTSATVWRNVVPTFIYHALNNMELPVENGGVATRDFIYIDDIVHGLLLCAINGKEGEVYNLATGIETSIMDLANIILKLVGNGTIGYMSERNWDHSGKRFGSTGKAFNELGFVAQVKINEGLVKTISWTKENIHRIKAAIQKHDIHMG